MAARQRWQTFVERNEEFAKTHEPSPDFTSMKNVPTIGVVISCMDPRVIPERFLNFGEMEMAVLRNAGGRAEDAMRSVRALDAIAGYGEGYLALAVVIHHTDCGLCNFTDDFIRNRLKRNAVGEHKHEVDNMDFGQIDDLDGAVREDVAIIKNDPFIPKETLVLGYIYDVFTGKLREVN